MIKSVLLILFVIFFGFNMVNCQEIDSLTTDNLINSNSESKAKNDQIFWISMPQFLVKTSGVFATLGADLKYKTQNKGTFNFDYAYNLFLTRIGAESPYHFTTNNKVGKHYFKFIYSYPINSGKYDWIRCLRIGFTQRYIQNSTSAYSVYLDQKYEYYKLQNLTNTTQWTDYRLAAAPAFQNTKSLTIGGAIERAYSEELFNFYFDIDILLFSNIDLVNYSYSYQQLFMDPIIYVDEQINLKNYLKRHHFGFCIGYEQFESGVKGSKFAPQSSIELGFQAGYFGYLISSFYLKCKFRFPSYHKIF